MQIGFNLVGYGCTTCIGNSGPIQKEISEAIAEGDLVATSVLSGNRNFEGRISARCARQLSGLAAAGRGLCAGRDAGYRPDFGTDRQDKDGNDVYHQRHLASQKEIAELVEANRDPRGVPVEICRRLQGRREMAGLSRPPTAGNL